MLSPEQHDQIIKVILTSTIVFLILHKVFGMTKTLTVLGLIANLLGTYFFIYGEVKRDAAFQKYKSSGEGEVSFNIFLQKQSWHIQGVVWIAIWILGGQGRIEEWARDAGKMDEDQLKELATKAGGLLLLFLGFFLQLIGVLL